MNAFEFSLAGTWLAALPSGALYWADQSLLCISDLHLGKVERHARRGGPLLPPYETQDTLQRLSDDLDLTQAAHVICLGDSFDDLTAARTLPEADRLLLTRLQAGRRWTWIEGNHDPGPIDMGGSHLAELALGPLIFRHIAQPGATAEISGHYHPKAQVKLRHRTISRPAFLIDPYRAILPAYGTYTGGLRSTSPELASLMSPQALAVLTGPQAHAVPMPR